MSEGTITSATVEVPTAAPAEPAWLQERRRAAWEQFRATPMPGRADEDWRRMDLDDADPEQYAPLAAANGTPPAAHSAPPAGYSAAVRFVDGQLERLDLPAELAAQGVLLCSLAEAARRHEDLVRRYFMTAAVSPDESKFALLHAAAWTNGTFLYVPPGVELAAPVLSSVRLTQPGRASYHHTLAIIEQGASVELVEESCGGAGRGLSVPVVEVFCGRGAKVGYYAVQNWDKGVVELATRRIVLEREAAATLADLALGASAAKTFVGSLLVGQGAACQLFGLYFPEAGQQFDYTTLQDHRVPDCTSDLLFKGALTEGARSAFRGVIRVHPDAQRTDAYQTNNNLLLGDDARADSMPVLEIEADDVKCSHGATLAHLDEEDLFYLTSRGLPRETAQRLVIGGFFEPVLDRLPVETLRERLHEQLAGRIERHRY